MEIQPRSSQSTVSEFTDSLPWWKRIVDVVGSIAALPLLAGVTFVLTVVAASSAPGPVLYRQECINCRGRRVRLYRFRTMHVRGSLVGVSAGAAAVAARSLPGGHLLRATGLAELPQILNILQGDMSLGDPRPLPLCGTPVVAVTALPPMGPIAGAVVPNPTLGLPGTSRHPW